MNKFACYSLIFIHLLIGSIESAVSQEREETFDEESLLAPDLSEEEDLIFTEIPTVSTVTRISQKASESLSNIYVITSDEIEQMGARNLADALRRVPGVDVSAIDGFQTQIGIRGANPFNSTKILILLNGRRIGMDLFGVTFWNLLPIAIEDIERIEVHRGPGTTYGANALAGVINIITKDSYSDPGGKLSGLGGTDDQWDAYGSYSFLGIDRSARISAKRFESHAFSTDSMTHYTQAMGTADLFNTEDSRLSISTGWNDFEGTRDIPLGPKRTLLEGLLGFTTLQYDRDLDDESSILFRLSLDHIDVNLPRLSTNPELQQDRVSGEFQHNFDLNEWNQIVWGLEAEGLFTDDRNVLLASTPSATDFYAGYLLDKITLSDEWLLYVGGRIEKHHLTEVNASPTASLVFHPTEQDVWRLSYSSAYRSPSFFESYGEIQATDQYSPDPFNHAFAGNLSVLPEVIHSVDLGYQAFRFSNNLQLGANVFAYRINRRIDLDQPSDALNSPENFVSNLGNADAVGLELSAVANPTVSTRLWASYTFQDVRFEETGVGLTNPAEHKASAGFGFDFWENFSFDAWMYVQSQIPLQIRESWDHHEDPSGDANLTLGESYQTADEQSAPPSRNSFVIDEYNLLNIRLAYKLFNKNLEMEFRGLNLLDDGHLEFPGERIGRQFLFGLTYRF